MDNKRLLITDDKVFEFNEDYIVPASYLVTYPNFKYHTQNLPRFKCSSRVVKEFEVVSRRIKKFPTNFNGITIEHLINTMLDVEKIDSSAFLIKNKSRLKYIGELPPSYDKIYMDFNSDGTVSAVDNKDKELVDELNKSILTLKTKIVPLVDYIKESIFKNKHILSQELVVHQDKNVLALCDLSSDSAVLEIKTYSIIDFNKLGDQLFYESNGRDCYIMQIVWSMEKSKITFVILKVEFEIDDSLSNNSLKSRIDNFKNRIANKQVDVVEYVDSHSKVTLRCQLCGNTFSKSYSAMLKFSECPYCNSFATLKTEKKSKTHPLRSKERQLDRAQKYFERLKENSAGEVSVLAYTGSKEKLTAHCNKCGYEWNIRADHLLARAYCPLCKKQI